MVILLRDVFNHVSLSEQVSEIGSLRFGAQLAIYVTVCAKSSNCATLSVGLGGECLGGELVCNISEEIKHASLGMGQSAVLGYPFKAELVITLSPYDTGKFSIRRSLKAFTQSAKPAVDIEY